jgi:GTPase
MRKDTEGKPKAARQQSTRGKPAKAKAKDPVAEESGAVETDPAQGPEGPLIEPGTRWEGLPLVVIAGRPNVGKSTLFNRLLHQRRAITDPTPGVTRDPIEEVCLLRRERPVRLLDTGGIKLDQEGLDSLVVEKSLGTFQGADLILLLLDVTETTGEDEELIERLRPLSPRVLLVANKADNDARESQAEALRLLGFRGPVTISSEHNRGIEELEDQIISLLDFSNAKSLPPEHEELRIALMGKPNTGKSTLMNRILGEDKSIVSDVPGTTRDVVEGRFTFKGRPFVLLDTAGIRRKAKVKENIEYYSVNRSIKSIEDADVVCLMVDAQEGLSDQDKKIAALAVEKGRGIIFVLNKWDLMPKDKKSLEAAKERLRFLFGHMAYAPIVHISALEGRGIEPLLDTAVSLFAQLKRRVETGTLNQALKRWMDERPPPVGPKTRFKIRYATQVSVNPVKFVLFVSRPIAATDAYISYIRNRFRKDLGFPDIPVEVEVKASRTPFEQRLERLRSE